jgi:lipopolysaccharide assembly protein A
MTEQEHPPPDRSQRRAATRSRNEQMRLVAALVLGGLAVLFAVLNLDRVRVHWIFFVSLTPLIVVILVCILVGVLIGWVTARRRG